MWQQLLFLLGLSSIIFAPRLEVVVVGMFLLITWSVAILFPELLLAPPAVTWIVLFVFLVSIPLAWHLIGDLLERSAGGYSQKGVIGSLALLLSCWYLFSSGLFEILILSHVELLLTAKQQPLAPILRIIGVLTQTILSIVVSMSCLWLLCEIPARLTASVAGVALPSAVYPVRLLIAAIVGLFLLSRIQEELVRPFL
jgi:hypothetical protein